MMEQQQWSENTRASERVMAQLQRWGHEPFNSRNPYPETPVEYMPHLLHRAQLLETLTTRLPYLGQNLFTGQGFSNMLKNAIEALSRSTEKETGRCDNESASKLVHSIAHIFDRALSASANPVVTAQQLFDSGVLHYCCYVLRNIVLDQSTKIAHDSKPDRMLAESVTFMLRTLHNMIKCNAATPGLASPEHDAQPQGLPVAEFIDEHGVDLLKLLRYTPTALYDDSPARQELSELCALLRQMHVISRDEFEPTNE